MKIGMQTWGSHGDIRPMLALAEGLSAVGHEVTLAVTDVHSHQYEQYESRHGVRLNLVASPSVADPNLAETIGKQIVASRNPVKQMQIIYDSFVVPVEAEMYEAAEELCVQNELIIAHFICHPTQVAAEKAVRPYVAVTLSHAGIPSRAAPPAPLPNLGSWGNRLSWWLARTIANRKLKPYIDRLRRSQGLPDANDLFRDVWSSSLLDLVAVSPSICMRQNDWPKTTKVCGQLDVADLPLEGRMSPALEDFLGKGDPPVYFTQGSVTPTNVEDHELLVDLYVSATTLSGCRAIIQTAAPVRKAAIDPERILFVSKTPHARVFPRCSVVVHHGGVGTTHAACRAGTPSVVIACLAEQTFWGKELVRMGLAPPPLHILSLKADKLGRALREVLRNPHYARNARRVASSMKGEDGVAQAVECIHELSRAETIAILEKPIAE